MLNLLPAHVVLAIAAAIIAAYAFSTLFTHVNEILFSPYLALAVGLFLLAKYSQAKEKKKAREKKE